MKKYNLKEYDGRLRDEMVVGSISKDEFASKRRNGVEFYVWEANDTIIAPCTYENTSIPGAGIHRYIWINENFRGDETGPQILTEVSEKENMSPYIIYVQEEMQEYWINHGFKHIKDDIFYI